VRRSYSICNAPGEGLRVGVRRQPNGRFSEFANRDLAPGDWLRVAPPDGRFTPTAPSRPGARFLAIVAGSGITPVLGIARAVLRDNPTAAITLLYGNRTSGSMMFREELLFLKNRYLDRLHLIPVFSQEAQDNPLFNGRIDNRKGAELIRRLLPLASYHEFFLCGPESMVSEVSRGLRSEGVPLAAIHWELFAASADAARERVRKHEERSRARGDRRSTVHVRLHGRRTTFELESDGENLLDRARALGLDAPFACKDGVCATCRARVVAGRVDMDVNQALTEDEVAAGYVLTCQSHPLSDVVEIDYDV
jgi:ring-1,2-phenylacetyl-CoA epoxidase subunit PaaE